MSSSNSSQRSYSSPGAFLRLKAAIRNCPPPYPNSTCECGFRLRVETSFTDRNPCRRFGNCGNKDCQCFTWIDEAQVPSYGKECLNLLLRNYGELAVEFERLKTKYEAESSISSRPRACDDCLHVMLRCEELEIQLLKKEKKIQVGILAGFVIGFLIAIFLVLISK